MKKILVILFGLICSLCEAEGEKYTLQLKYKKGDKIRQNIIVRKLEIEKNMVFQQCIWKFPFGGGYDKSGGPYGTFPFKCEYADKILELDKNEQIKKLERKVLLCEYGNLSGGEYLKLKNLEGKILTITKGKQKELQLPSELITTIDENIGIFLPEKPVELKEKWEVSSQKIKQLINYLLPKNIGIVEYVKETKTELKNISGKIECQLDSVNFKKEKKIAKISYRGNIDAVIEMEGDFKGKGHDTLENIKAVGNCNWKNQLDGEFYFNITKDKPISLNSNKHLEIILELKTPPKIINTTISTSLTEDSTEEFIYE